MRPTTPTTEAGTPELDPAIVAAVEAARRELEGQVPPLPADLRRAMEAVADAFLAAARGEPAGPQP